MKKLSLDTDQLQVESFPTAAAIPTDGTVFGYVTARCPTGLGCGTEGDCLSIDCDTLQQTCNNNYTCIRTCQGLTCEYQTCGDCNPTDPNCTTVCY